MSNFTVMVFADEKKERDLAPGKCAVIAESSEEWLTPLDTRMEELGAKIVRIAEIRSDFTERTGKLTRARELTREALQP